MCLDVSSLFPSSRAPYYVCALLAQAALPLHLLDAWTANLGRDASTRHTCGWFICSRAADRVRLVDVRGHRGGSARRAEAARPPLTAARAPSLHRAWLCAAPVSISIRQLRECRRFIAHARRICRVECDGCRRGARARITAPEARSRSTGATARNTAACGAVGSRGCGCGWSRGCGCVSSAVEHRHPRGGGRKESARRARGGGERYGYLKWRGSDWVLVRYAGTPTIRCFRSDTPCTHRHTDTQVRMRIVLSHAQRMATYDLTSRH